MGERTPAEQIDDIIAQQSSWKAALLSEVRDVINATDPGVSEDVKWKTASRPEGLPVWSYEGIICIAESWKDNIKLVFFKGATLRDENKLFNARLKSSTDRAIEFREGDSVNRAALTELVKEAIELNQVVSRTKRSR